MLTQQWKAPTADRLLLSILQENDMCYLKNNKYFMFLSAPFNVVDIIFLNDYRYTSLIKVLYFGLLDY